MEASGGKVENHVEAPEHEVENQNEAPEDKVENQNDALEDKVENQNDAPEDEVENQNPEDKVEYHIKTPEDELENQKDAPEDKVENHNNLESSEDKEENQDQESVVIPPVIYRCKKCRRIVATQDLVIPHERGESQECFSYGKKNSSKTVRFIRTSNRNEAQTPECTSIFVEPMNWMESVTQYGCLGDKIVCMGCKARLGSFHWAGMRCNCGKYITPAFQLHKNRLDESSF